MPPTFGQKMKWIAVGGSVTKLNREAVDLFNAGQPQEALKKLLLANKKYGWHAPVHHNLANVYNELGLFREAEEHFKMAIDIKPDFVEAMNDYGAFLHKQNRVSESFEHFKKAIELNPTYPYSHVNFAQVLIARGRFKEAEQELQAALDCSGLDAATRKKIEDQLSF